MPEPAPMSATVPLKLLVPDRSAVRRVNLSISATLTAWTPEEWAALDPRPPGVFECTNGVRVAIDLD
jgi:hypothetical protein